MTVRQQRPPTRPQRIDMRVSAVEAEAIIAMATKRHVSPSAFVRGAALAAARFDRSAEGGADAAATGSRPTLSDADRAVLDAARVETKRVGVNLNQLVRLAHRGEIDLGALAPMVEGLADQQQRIIDLLGGRNQ